MTRLTKIHKKHLIQNDALLPNITLKIFKKTLKNISRFLEGKVKVAARPCVFDTFSIAVEDVELENAWKNWNRKPFFNL